ncbi:HETEROGENEOUS NUCLEAR RIBONUCLEOPROTEIN U FAMILY MEMBER [Salix viminalis]|uniref:HETEROGENEOUS NUCLEAR RIBONUCLEOPROTEIN U FAMILY MEMBER n=1 Tax=Salix viminalis TaxID=40686 RepID=A0A9Q0QHV3_SALVM|nr:HETEROGENEOUS NUCLEAR RIBONUCLEOPROTEIN U FAMILY MEMBER [Salix viminalis]
MVAGLPASGKTTWTRNWADEYPEKRSVLLGRNLILDEMRVPGLLYSVQFFINQTNVFKNACTHKLRPFSNFCKIAVVAFPKPEDLEFRVGKRFKEMGMEVPADATNNMIANYALSKSKDMPVPDELSDQVKIWIYISRFALWNSLLSTTYISGSISKVPVLIFLLACSSILEDINPPPPRIC